MKRQIISCFILALLSSCSKDGGQTDGGGSLVNMDVTITPQNGTKAITTGSYFPKDGTMGLFICKHESGTPSQFVEYSFKYNNLLAVQTSDTVSSPVWNYKYGASSSSVQFPTLFLLMPSTGEKAADFYAYAPYISGVTNPAQIPFTLSYNTPDLMYAPENNTDTNRNKLPDGEPITVSYHFVHKFAWLQFKFFLKNDEKDGTLGPGSDKDSGNKSKLSAITIKRNGSTPLPVSGYFNGINGTFTDVVTSDSLRVDFPNMTAYHFGTLGKTIDILICPETLLADGDYELVFTINGSRIETTYPIKIADLRHSDGVTVGFREGYRYVFTFTYDNYHHVQLKSTQVDSDADWTDFPEQKEIVI